MRGRKLVPHFLGWCIMIEILIIAAIAGLAILTGVKSKAVGNIALGFLYAISYFCVGVFLLGIAVFVIAGIWWAVETYIL